MRRLGLALAMLLVQPGWATAQPVSPPPASSSSAESAKLPDSAKQCDAADLAYLIGRSRNEIPVPVDPSRRRVACTSCPVTEDYRPERTNIRYDARTGIVKSVTCG